MELHIYIHGVVPLPAHDHTEDYRAFRDGVSAELINAGGDPLPGLEDSVTVEWGWGHSDAGDTGLLDKAQAVIADRVEAATPTDRTGWTDLIFAPAITPVRGLIQHTWADIVYYTSEKGKAAVREVVWGHVLRDADPGAPLDLTIIGHSAGSLIAHDFLFWLYSGQRDDDEALRELGLDPSAVHAARANWRVRRLVTFGSPVAPLLVRSTAVTEIIAGGGRLDAADLGLATPSNAGPDPIWLNLWDRHDVLSWPVQPFYTGGAITDIYPDHSDSLLGSHEAYWRAGSVHRAFAALWNAQP